MKKLGAFISSLCLVATWFVGTAAAQSGAGLNFYAEPAPGSSTKDGYYLLEAEPGDSITQRLTLRNDSKEKVVLRIYPSDGTTSVFGGADYTMPDVEPEGVGTWIVLQEDKVRLKPKSSKQITFRVRVPEDAPSGENLGGISIFPVVKPEEQTDVNQSGNVAGAQIVVEYRRVIAVQVNTPGKAEPKLLVSGITPTARPDGAYVDLNIANEGTALTTGQGTIEIPGLDYKREFSLDTFVPNSNIDYPLRVDDSLPTGEHEASVRIEYDEGDKVVEWTNTFAVGDDLLRELAERGAPGAPSLTTRGNLVPYAAVLATAMFAYMMWKRTRRPDEAVVPQAPTPLGTFSVGGDEPNARPQPIETRVAERPTDPIEGRVILESTRRSEGAAPITAPKVSKPAGGKQAPTRKRTTATTRSTTATKTSVSKKKTTARRSAKKTTAAKTPAKKTAAKKKTATKRTRTAEARKTAATKKTTARKATRTRAATKTTAKKTTARKTTARKTTARKTTARKTTASKKTSGAKTSARRKSTASKTSSKKTAARKTTAAAKNSAKKTASRKTTARKTAKKASPRKPTRKPPAKKTAARKKAS